MTEDEMVGWHHWLKGHEYEQTQGDSDGQRSGGATVLGGTKSQTWLSNWTAATIRNFRGNTYQHQITSVREKTYPMNSWDTFVVVQLLSHDRFLGGPHGLQHARLPCPSLSPGVCSNSCPLSRWCYLTISSSVVPFSFCLQYFLLSGSFSMRSQLFTPRTSRLTKLNLLAEQPSGYLRARLWSEHL